MKNNVRPIDANALAKRIKEYMSDFPNAGTRLTACRAVLSMLGDEEQTPTLQPTCNNVATSCTDHFPDLTKMVPLTLEQLQGMGGKPYWHVSLQDDGLKPHWKILDPFVAKRPEDYGYEERWLAYAYHPTHIDLDAWAPCRMCENPSSLNRFLEMNCRYCPKCGRPLTKGARAELEKRLRG